jgi:hypothetical protein
LPSSANAIERTVRKNTVNRSIRLEFTVALAREN